VVPRFQAQRFDAVADGIALLVEVLPRQPPALVLDGELSG